MKKKLGKSSKASKLTREMNYKKEKMLKTLTMTEDKTDPKDPTMLEITYKQNKRHGLTIVNDELFDFFKTLHIGLQNILSTKNMHLHLHNNHIICRDSIDKTFDLLSKWINLFENKEESNFEDEILLDLITDLYQSVSEHFIRLSIVDSLKQLKRSIPRKTNKLLELKFRH